MHLVLEMDFYNDSEHRQFMGHFFGEDLFLKYLHIFLFRHSLAG